MHVLKVLHALTYVATRRIATAESTVESLTSHTYTSSAGKIPRPPILAYLRFIKINTSTKMDSDQTPGRTGQQEATRPEGIVQDAVQNVRWPTSFVTPLISCSGSETKTTSPEFWNNRPRQPTTAESRHGLLIFHTPDY